MTGYPASLQYLYGLEKSGIILGLDNISWLLGLLGNPERDFASIHVGGTNGKGSVVSMLTQILKKSGYATGTYTSPHLVDFTERIQVNGERIRKEEMVALTERIRGLTSQSTDPHRFSFFDFTTAMALLYFKERMVDWAVVEVGMGGRLDSTNAIHPAVSIIMNVAKDHMEHLGNDIRQIAAEKAGIIKEGVPVVTGASGEALEVIKDKAADRSRVFVLGQDFSYEKLDDQRFSYRGLRWELRDISVGLLGDHQLSNAAIALCAAELLSRSGLDLSPDKIRAALSTVQWPGRLEMAAENPPVLLDAAHNPHGAQSLAAFLKAHYGDRRIILVFGVMRDKDWKEILNLLLPLASDIILTRPAIERAAPPELLARSVPGATLADDVKGALSMARKRAVEGDIIVVTGSLYTVGEAKTAIYEAA
ncbi:MAG TPA: bifunctional folylpolyglutamate synthase/dihydrofolate synthase [Deltaproteobacteria bacterium]|nr:bifunctional folylpolyglutamate synthase/dihydrofolate synthase [Deltaproteobacteria bacterium]